jgi:hypothetical protein
MNEWSEKVDVGFEKRDRQITEIFERLRKLEERR